MAENPQSQAQPARPLSPHLTIYHWAPTMIVSITHRATGVALCVGMLVLAWWLVSISNGPEVYQHFYSGMGSVPGLVILFGFAWSLAFHLLQGIRHLAWDLGYGYRKETARLTALLVAGLSLVIAAAIAVFVWTGHAGYLQMKSMQTPLHKVQGLGPSHTGTNHFWHERVTALALVPLTLWFFYAALGLAGASEAAAISFLSLPLNAILMAAFVIISLYHMKLGLQVIIDDYVHGAGAKILLLLLVRFAVIATGAFALFALIRIAGQT